MYTLLSNNAIGKYNIAKYLYFKTLGAKKNYVPIASTLILY